ncbi:LytTR family DNA-binding domain-containing protein [bacterium]|nr:LytTR family DNA-binding domain-containing protein [bacterium]
MIKAVVIDDWAKIREANKRLLSKNFPEIQVVGEADSVDDGIRVIQDTNPDIVLLDIEINGGTGFDILQKLRPYNFKVVFITAFNDFAIKAFKFSAFDYIMKPVDEQEFVQSIENALTIIDKHQVEQQITHFFDHYEKKTQSKKIILRTSELMHIVEISEILFCKSDNSYTTFFLKGSKEILVSKPIKEYTELLEGYGFIRPHQSYLVNIHCIKMIDKSDGGFIIMCNGKEIPVSSRKKQALISELDKL